jgi:hypothetical protein
MRKVQNKAWGEGLTAGSDAGGVSTDIETGMTAKTVVSELSGCADVFPSRFSASLAGVSGRLET